MAAISDSVFIYVLKCPISGAVRYIGKTLDVRSRLRKHVHEAKHRYGKNHRANWIRSLLSSGLEPVIEVDVVTTRDGWKKAETDRIAHYRALGCDLTNATDGGDGKDSLSDDGRRALSARVSEYFKNPENRKKHCAAIAASAHMRDPAFIAHRRAVTRESWTVERKTQFAETMRAKWADPAFVERWRASRQSTYKKPEYRALLSDRAKNAHKDPKVRAAKADAVRLSWADPEVRARRSKAIREAMARRNA